MVSIINNGPAPACAPSFNLTDYVLAAGKRTPAKTALILASPTTTEIWTYKKLRQAVLGTARGLHNMGVCAGDRVVLALGNTVDFPILFLAICALDAIPAPVSPQLQLPEIQKISTELSPNFVISDRFVQSQLPQIRVISAVEAREMHSVAQWEPIMGDPNRPAYIIFTSGTSGHPKAVVHAHRAVWARRMMWDAWYDMGKDDLMLHAGAFNWTYTLGTGLLDPWAMGATTIIPQGLGVSDLWSTMEQTGTTIFAASPGVLRKLIKSPPVISPPTLRHALSAGDTLPTATRIAWEEKTGTPICQAFGMTECSTFLSSTTNTPTKIVAQPGRHIAVVNDGAPVPQGTTGNIAVHKDDPGLMLGYLAGERLDLPLVGPWFQTADRFQMGKDGTLIFQGRASDIMNAGGFRVAPREVEIALEPHSHISEIAVCEIEIKPDVYVIAAFIVARDDQVDIQSIEQFAESHLARYKQPRLYRVVNALPRNTNGKLIRKDLPNLWKAQNDQT